jgi:hypothetical protein
MGEIKIILVNHASILIEYKSVKLLTDPWFSGSCFENGWGLLYQNSQALDIAKTATHLWVSHFHGDHFHIETLRQILAINPSITAYGNCSYNFKIDDALKRIGFSNIISLGEKKKVIVNDDFIIERIPTTGIDNMLVIKTSEGTILNYNDCNIPLRTRKYIANKIGQVHVMLNNFNHAGKLISFPLPTVEEIKAQHKENFLENTRPFNPKYVIPFASYHYYKAVESQQQNASLLSLAEILPLQHNIVNAPLGSCISFTNAFENCSIALPKHTLEVNQIELTRYEKQYTLAELQQAALVYIKKIRKGFGIFANKLPDLEIYVSDLNMALTLHMKKGLLPLTMVNPTHIIAHSEALYKWFTQPFGTDSFIVGAHFDITKHEMPIKWQTLLALLTENRLDMVSICKMFFSVSGLRFLWNRKNEITSILLSRKLLSSNQRK